MSTPAWSELEALFHEALACPAAERVAVLAERCAGRPELRVQVEAMLRSHDEARGALDVSAMRTHAPLEPGTRLGVYEIVGRLGAGGMGEVYRARDTKLRRDVAIKILPSAFVTDADRAARFEREARVLAALNHPHIAAIYGFEQGALILELVEGETLADRIARGPWRTARRGLISLSSLLCGSVGATHHRRKRRDTETLVKSAIAMRRVSANNVAFALLRFGQCPQLDPALTE